MTPEELIAYGRGYLDGWARGEHAAMTQPLDPDGWRAAVAEWRRTTEMSLHRLMWDAAVKRGENPTPKEAQNGQARQRPDVESEGRLPAEARPGREGDPGAEQGARGEAARTGQDQVKPVA